MVLKHTAALATDVISGPSQGFQSTTAEEIQMSSQNEIQARLHCVCPLRACATHFPRAAQTTETPETPPPQGPFRAARQGGVPWTEEPGGLQSMGSQKSGTQLSN